MAWTTGTYSVHPRLHENFPASLRPSRASVSGVLCERGRTGASHGNHAEDARRRVRGTARARSVMRD